MIPAIWLLFLPSAWSQNQPIANTIISSIAGRDWIFPGDGKPANQAALGGIDGLAFDGDGNLYISDFSNVMIFRIDRAGTLSVVAGNGLEGFSGDGGQARNASLRSPRGITFDAAGNLYLADWANHRIRRITPAGVITTIAGTGVEGFTGDGGAATAARLSYPYGLAFDSSGTLYFTQSNRVRAITPDGRIRTVAGTGVDDSTGDGGPAIQAAIRPHSIVVTPEGLVIFSEWDGQRVRAIDTNGVIRTIAGTGIRDFARNNTLATQSPLRNPAGLAYDSQGRLYIAESNGPRILRIDSDGILRFHAGNGSAVSTPDGPALTTSIGWVWPLAVGPGDEIHFKDAVSDKVRKVAAGAIVSVAGSARFQSVPDGTPASLSYFLRPAGLTFDPGGGLVVADRAVGRIGRISPEGTYTLLGGTISAFCCGDGGPARSGFISDPSGVAVDNEGQIYIADTFGHRIRFIDRRGILSTIAGTGAAGFSGDGGPAARALLNQPNGLVLDTENALIFTEYQNRRVRRISRDGVIRTIAGDGQNRYFGDDGPAASASFRAPLGIARTAAGDLLIADVVDHRIRKISVDGTISTFAGTGQSGFTGDGGPATQARLNAPSDLTVGGDGSVYFLDRGNRRVRKIDSRGVISTVAGDGRSLFSGDGGLASKASFGALDLGITADPSGRVFVSDPGAHRIRVIEDFITTLTLPANPVRITVAQGEDAVPVPISMVATRAGVPVELRADVPWLHFDNSTVIAPATVLITASAKELAPGAYNAVIQATSDVSSAVLLPVILSVTPRTPPRLTVSPSEITRTLSTSSTEQARIKVTNTGSVLLRFSAGVRLEGGAGWMTLASAVGSTTSLSPGEFTELAVSFQTSSIAPGTYSGAVVIEPEGSLQQTVRVTLQVQQQRRPRILLSQVGFTFTVVALGGTPSPQSLGILNEGTGELSFNARALTLSGGDWLRVTPGGGRLDRPLRDVSFVDVSVQHEGLEAGEYYGRVEVTAGAADNTPQNATILLKVLPPGSAQVPEVRPAGLVFISEAGTDPGSQTIRVSNTQGGSAPFVSVPLTSDRGPWLKYSPDIGVSTTQDPAAMVVQPEHRTLSPGVRTGAVNLLFTDTGETRAVRVLSVVAPLGTTNGAGKLGLERRLGSCAGATLRLQHLSLENSFVAVAGEPTDIRVRVIDDCGTPLTPQTAPNPLVSINADTGDEVRLVHVQDGEWRGTWRPRTARESATVAITVIAGDLRTPVEILLRTGRVLPFGGSPTVRSGALRHSATLQTDMPVAPGHLISIIGTGLADKEEAVTSAPYPRSLNETEVWLGGKPLALLYTSSGQINAQIPYDVPANTEQQLYVRRGRALSVPERFIVAAAQPGIFAVNQQGFGQGFIVLADGTTVADARSPAPRGGEVIVFCSGLGAVTPEVEAGLAPSGSLPRVLAPVEVTIGGRRATIVSATISREAPGRYEVRVQVPPDAPVGAEIPVVMSAYERVSPVVTMAIR